MALISFCAFSNRIEFVESKYTKVNGLVGLW